MNILLSNKKDPLSSYKYIYSATLYYLLLIITNFIKIVKTCLRVNSKDLTPFIFYLRDDLKQDSFLVCNSVCFLHKKYFKQKLSALEENEISEVENILKNVFDMK